MIIKSPLYGDINVPDTSEAIMAEINRATELIRWKYSRELQIYLDALNEGLDILRFKGGSVDAV